MNIVFYGFLSIMSMSLCAGSVSQVRIEKAARVPEQSSFAHERSWSCGPNSLHRFLILSGIEISSDRKDYEKLVKECPRSCGKPTTLEGYGACAALAATSVGSALVGWDGYSDVACAVVTGACALAPFVIEAFNYYKGAGKVGPTPRWLAGYGNKLLASHAHKTIKVGQFDDESKLIAHLKAELDAQRPVMVLVNFAPLRWHYINIISYEGDSFSYLDTNGAQNTYTQSTLISRMDFAKETTIARIQGALKHVGFYLGIDIERFNLLYMAESDQ